MDKRDECCSTHLIGGDGNFHVEGIQNFMKEVKFAECGVAYAVVAIMGPQSSGKSTLLNHLFGTNFREMDVSKGRLQTTKGIWLARCVGIEPCTLVMDLEGTDSSERGEDDTAFEKQSALFALAVSDIFLINMWCHDIGRTEAANKPLLKTVFQVMMTLFSPRKTTLMFVIRDKTKAPFEILESGLREDIQKIWDSVLKENARKETPLNEFFDVQVVALSSFEYNEEQFKEQVAGLRKRFMHSISPGGLAGDRRRVVPASGFMFSAQEIWKVIKENKDLNLPAHKVMVATVRCEEIADAKFSSFVANEEWRELEEMVQSQSVPKFGKKLASIIDACLSEYDVEAAYFDESVSSRKRKQLEEKLLQRVQPAYQFMLGHSHAGTLSRFKKAFESALNEGKGFAAAASNCTEYYISQFNDASASTIYNADTSVYFTGHLHKKSSVFNDRANWDASEVRDKLRRDMGAHVIAVRATKLSELTATYEKKLNDMLSGPVEALLDSASDETWPSIRKLLLLETETAVDGFSRALSGFEIDDATKDKMILSLQDYSRGVLEVKAREEAGRVLIRMKDRFSTLFSQDADSMPRVWSGKEDICAITKTARAASLKLLSVMAAIRLDDNSDAIEKTLSIALFDPGSGASSTTSRSLDPLASSIWGQVEPSKTLLTPVQCKSLWRQFEDETKYIVSQATIAAQVASRRNNNWMRQFINETVYPVSQAIAAQDAKIRSVLNCIASMKSECDVKIQSFFSIWKNWMPPPWAIVALLVLAFIAFMTLLRYLQSAFSTMWNPLWLAVIFVVFLLVKTTKIQSFFSIWKNWMPPPWAIVALLVLGFNEFMTLLRNSLCLAVIFVVFLFVKALWVQLDISGEFRNGVLPGVLALSTKFVPTVMNLLGKLAEEGNANSVPQQHKPQTGMASDRLSSSASSEVTSTKNGTEYSSPPHQKSQ